MVYCLDYRATEKMERGLSAISTTNRYVGRALDRESCINYLAWKPAAATDIEDSQTSDQRDSTQEETFLLFVHLRQTDFSEVRLQSQRGRPMYYLGMFLPDRKSVV